MGTGNREHPAPETSAACNPLLPAWGRGRETRAFGWFQDARWLGGIPLSLTLSHQGRGDKEQTGNIFYKINREHGLHVHAPENYVPTSTLCNRDIAHGSTARKATSCLRSPPPSVGEGQGEGACL